MTTLSPKKLEIRERRNKILDAARTIIVREGYHALGMERVAEAVDYSRGTIYNHFSCKEEIVFALAEEGAAKRAELFRVAAQYQDISRFRLLALAFAAEFFVIKYPDYFAFEQIFKLDSVREKTSLERQKLIHDCEIECVNTVASVIRDAINDGDLTLPTNTTPEQLVFGLWAITQGSYGISFTSPSLPHTGIENPFLVVRRHVNRLLDGYKWTPLLSTHDIDKVYTKIEKAIGDQL